MAGLFNQTQEEYYSQSQSAWSTEPDGNQETFTLTTVYFPSLSTFTKSSIRVFVNEEEIDTDNYSLASPSGSPVTAVLTFSGNQNNADVLESDGAPKTGLTLKVQERSLNENFGVYQYVSLTDIINNFMIAYVGESKLIGKVSKTDVNFHAKRGLAEFSYDTLRSHKAQEIEVPPSLISPLPHDYVNYTKITTSDGNGTEMVLYPTRYTSNPKSLLQNDDYDYLFDADGTLLEQQPTSTWNSYKSTSSGTSESNANQDDSTDIEWKYQEGRRYGISPENAQDNGSFYIDLTQGRIHFSSGLSGKTVVIKYISDTLGTDDEMRVHKFAEEALYKHIAHAILSSRINIPEYIVARYKKERYAALRNAKLRLSNLKSEELAQVMRNKSKQIKH